MRLEIRRLEELEVFDALRLSVEVLAEVLPEVLADIAADVAGRTELLIKLAGGTELEARVEIRQPEELEVLFVVVRY